MYTCACFSSLLLVCIRCQAAAWPPLRSLGGIHFGSHKLECGKLAALAKLKPPLHPLRFPTIMMVFRAMLLGLLRFFSCFTWSSLMIMYALCLLEGDWLQQPPQQLEGPQIWSKFQKLVTHTPQLSSDRRTTLAQMTGLVSDLLEKSGRSFTSLIYLCGPLGTKLLCV